MLPCLDCPFPNSSLISDTCLVLGLWGRLSTSIYDYFKVIDLFEMDMAKSGFHVNVENQGSEEKVMTTCQSIAFDY